MQSVLRRTIPASLDSGDPVHLVTTWFRRSDPYGVIFEYDDAADGRALSVRIERETLRALVDTPDAMMVDGTTVLWMAGDKRLTLEIAEPERGSRRLEFDAATMRVFLEETEMVIPFGAEGAVVNDALNDAIARPRHEGGIGL